MGTGDAGTAIPPGRTRTRDPAPSAIRPPPAPDPRPGDGAGGGGSHGNGGPARVRSGNALLDHLLRGGFPRGTVTLLQGPAYSGKLPLACGFASSMAASGEALVVGLTALAPEAFRARTAEFGPALAKAEEEGRVAYVDAQAGLLGEARSDRLVAGSPRPGDFAGWMRAMASARARLGEPERMAVVVHTVTDLSFALEPRGPQGRALSLQRLAARCRQWGATTVLVADQHVHEGRELAELRHVSDGALELTETADARTYLRARGLGGAATQEWVEYRMGERGLEIVGSLTEQKIR